MKKSLRRILYYCQLSHKLSRVPFRSEDDLHHALGELSFDDVVDLSDESRLHHLIVNCDEFSVKFLERARLIRTKRKLLRERFLDIRNYVPKHLVKDVNDLN